MGLKRSFAFFPKSLSLLIQLEFHQLHTFGYCVYFTHCNHQTSESKSKQSPPCSLSQTETGVCMVLYLGIPLARGTPSQLMIKLVRNRSQVQPGHYQDYLCHPGLRCWIIHTATKQPFSWPFILSHSQVPASSSILVE